MAGNLGKHPRRLRIEPLENRRMLAVAMVDTELDVVDLADGVTSLREAIFATNILAGPDTIEFDPSLDGKTILLTLGELEIADELTIQGNGAELLTIDAQQQSRIFNITAATGDSSISGLTLTQGQTTGDNADHDDTTFNGGAIRSITDGLLTIDSSVITGNSTTGDDARGGGVFVYGYIEVTSSTISGNSTAGDGARGGGISMHIREFDFGTPGSNGALTVTDSVVTDNHTTGLDADGGGLDAFSRNLGFVPPFKNAGIVILTRSEVNHNSTSGSGSSGGGIFATGDVRLDHSEVIGNSATGVLVIPGGDGSPEGGGPPSFIHSGGGIYNTSGHVELFYSRVNDNFTTGLGSGGIRARYGVTLDHSTVNGNTAVGNELGVRSRGGGILVSRNLSHGVVINQSTISNNSVAGEGGGIYVNSFEPRSAVSSITISHSTISGNSASESGGGLFLEASIRGGTTDLWHNTIANNTSDLSGGGLYIQQGTASVEHTIVSGNTDNSGVAHDVYGNIQSSFSLIGDNTGSGLTEAPAGAPDANGNFIGGPVGGVIDSQLGPLADNGGPTLTHALLPGSPAIDMGDSAAMAGVGDVPPTDQRGGLFTRVSGGRIDIGAYEAQPFAADFDENGVVDGRDFLALQLGYGTPSAQKVDGDADGDQDVDALDRAIWEAQYGLEQPQELPSLVVTTELDAVDPFDGLTSLREAIVYANGLAGADTIEFDASLSGKTILLAQGELLITESLTVNGLGQDLLTIDAQQNSRIFNITASTGNFSFGGLTLTGGKTTANGDGGAIRSVSSGDLTIEGSTVSGNGTLGYNSNGGGIFAYGSVMLTDSTVSDNSTSGQFADGGGIFTRRHVTLTGSNISGNSTSTTNSEGGGVYTRIGDVTLTDSTVSGNTTSGDDAEGGAIYARFGDVTITRSTVSGNSTSGASAQGGGIFAHKVTLTDSTVSGNSTSGDDANGGGIYGYLGGVTLTGSTVSGNGTLGNSAEGGAIFSRTRVTLTNSTVSGNSTSGSGAEGGGIVAKGSVALTSSTVSGNSTLGEFANGGGIVSNLRVILTKSTVSGNWTQGDVSGGGGIRAPEVTITRSTVSGNSTQGNVANGGGIRAIDVTITRSTVSGNFTQGNNTDGGGIAAFGNVTISQSTIVDNHATDASSLGGGIFVHNDPIAISHSIVAGNMAGGSDPDLHRAVPESALLTVDYSLTGTGITPDSGANNISTDVPQLGPLQNNGGPTLTHALLPGSPAIDMGDPAFDPSDPDGDPSTDDALPYDQRGLIYSRVFGGRIDIGAVESQPQHADFDGDGSVTGLDFLAWQRGSGTPAPLAVKGYGDADDDTDVDGDDLAAWENAYGAGAPAPLVAAVAVVGDDTATFSNAQLVDLAVVAELLKSEFGIRIAESYQEPSASEPVREEAFASLDASTRQDEDAAVALAGERQVDLADNVAEPDLAHEQPESLADDLLERVFS